MPCSRIGIISVKLTTFFAKHQRGKVTTLIVHVNGIVVIGDDQCEIHDLKSFLGTKFEFKDLGHLRYFIGIEVSFSHSVNMF